MSDGKLRKQANKVGEYSLVGIGDSKFQGYNARTDGTTIGNNWLVSPSQNVMIGTIRNKFRTYEMEKKIESLQNQINDLKGD